ncbi:IPTL-CTERM sorting domain-containing protein [Brevundimonas staleyi]|uniref:IPTL-CTERM sorting domain-containing protein n=1 Tax=Brevundimonas staleyi TaxID=74326 RepID=A0ABW0FV50_9CAUL
MRLLIFAAALAGALIASQAMAQATNYTFTSGLYDTIGNSTTCTIGECATFTSAHRATATLTYAAPLAPNLPHAEYSAGVIAYTFSDGVRTTTGPSPITALYRVEFATDGAGVPIQPVITFERTPGPPYTVNDAGDPNSLVSFINFLPLRTVVGANTICSSRGVGMNPSPGPGSCNAVFGGLQSSGAESNVAPVVTVAAVHPVPTLSEWALILLGLTLAGGAALAIQRRRLTA